MPEPLPVAASTITMTERQHNITIVANMLNNPSTQSPTREEALTLGLTQNTSGSEFQAGMRAELTPSPLTRALTSMRSQIVAQTLITLLRYREAMHFVSARIPMLQEVIRRGIPPHQTAPVIVDPAAGFSAVSIELAQKMPRAVFVDLDLPEVMRTRLSRLQKANLALSPNIKSMEANLNQTPLGEMLENQPIDVVNFTGAYFTPDQLQMTLRYLHSLLGPGGAAVCYLPWMPGVNEIKFAARFFKKQVGEYPGMMHSAEQIHQLFSAAGYRDVTIFYPTTLAEELRLPTPILDIEVLALGRK